MPKRRRSTEDYTVGWVCALPIELGAAAEMLDEEHEDPPPDRTDNNLYTLGRIGYHNVVIACLPAGQIGTNSAAAVAMQMKSRFRSIRFGLLVGIGGGVPTADSDIRLGDVVVSQPHMQHGGVVQYDLGKTEADGHYTRTGLLNTPPTVLLNALAKLRANHYRGRTSLPTYLSAFDVLPAFRREKAGADILFQPIYNHAGGATCEYCSRDKLVERAPRTSQGVVLHYGTIASGNQVMKDGVTRDRLNAELGGVLCFEMEAAGLMNNFPCLVIRGICDYADTHKNKEWQPYAAATAAACGKEILSVIPAAEVAQAQTVDQVIAVTPAPCLVPFGKNPHFVGRETQLKKLETSLSSTEDFQQLAIWGLGGCGKTAIALEFAYRIKEKYPGRAVFWIPAISRDSFEKAYRDIGTVLDIPGVTDDKADVKRLVKTRLDNEDFGEWLMIVDNADDLDILFEKLDDSSNAARLFDYLPRSRKGSIVFTTRTRKAAVHQVDNNVLELGELSEVEAKEVLGKRLIRKNQLNDNKVVHEFLKLLAFLPLAIVQAVAFLNENDVQISEYISLYKDTEENRLDLLSQDFEDQSRYRETKNPVAITWYISFEQIQKQDPLAADYLSFMACVARESIPTSLLLSGRSTITQKKAIGTLTAYAFVASRQRPQKQEQEQEVGVGEACFDVHRLVHLATRNWLRSHGQWPVWIDKAMMRLVDIVPFGDHERREVWVAYLPHAIHVATLPDLPKTEAWTSLLDRIGSCQNSLGQYKAAEGTHRQILRIRRKDLGKQHPGTLTSMNNMAQALRRQGKYVEAEKMHRETLALDEKVSGTEHPDTLISMSNVAQALSDQGKYVEAEKMHRETLVLRKKILGTEHPDTLTSMNNVAQILSSQGKYVEAEKMHRETLILRKKISGTEHSHTLTSMNNVAQALNSQGKYVEAEKMHRETLILRKKVLGIEHPYTLTSMSNVAQALSGQKKYVEAEKMHRETLALDEKVLGIEHPYTLTSMSNVAQALSGQGKYVEAEKMHRETLALDEKVSGIEHPNTLTSMSNVAQVLSGQRKYVEAEKIYRETLILDEKVLGTEHPDTLTSMNNVARALSKTRNDEVSIS